MDRTGPALDADAARARAEGAAPTWLVATAGLVLAFNVVLTLAGSLAIGVSWDEPVHVQRLQNYLDSGWYVPNHQLRDGAPQQELASLQIYGPVAALATHVPVVLAGAGTWESVPGTSAAYAARHVGVAVLGVLGLVATGAIAGALLRSFRWGLVAAAVLSAMPLWTGHSMFNIKDIPVATGFTVATLGLVLLSRLKPDHPRRRGLTAAGVLAAGLVLAVGTRAGVWAPLGVSAVVMLAASRWADDRRLTSHADDDAHDDGSPSRAAPSGHRLAWTAGGFLAAWAVLAITLPTLYGNRERLFNAVATSADYPWTGEILTAGQMLPMPPPAWYLPAWLLAQTPLLVLIAVPFGLAAAVSAARRGRAEERDGGPDLAAGCAPVAVQLLLIPAIAILTGSVIYDGTRQFLFLQPAMAVFATLGLVRVLGSARDRSRLLRMGVSSAVVLGLMVPTVTQGQLFPYSYTWFNAPTVIAGIDGRWPTDYWRLSAAELADALPAEDVATCVVERDSESGVWIPCARAQSFAPYWTDRPGTTTTGGGFIAATFNRGRAEPFDGCVETARVDRTILWHRFTLSHAAFCPSATALLRAR